MRQLPVLFSTPMVQAILEDRKTMITRRTKGLEKVNENPDDWSITIDTTEKGILFFNKNGHSERMKPQYQVGDQIYVRETHFALGYWKYTGNKTNTGKDKNCFVDLTIESKEKYRFFDTIFNVEFTNKIIPQTDFNETLVEWHQRQSLFMPKEAARIWLECTSVRCERLLDITEGDSLSEGVYRWTEPDINWFRYKDYTNSIDWNLNARSSFISLWRSIDGDDSIKLNPWVFVYSFGKITIK